ncbi:MAG: hypothetical protein ACOC87_03780, partial [Candidatus Natronoplasma sp.]
MYLYGFKDDSLDGYEEDAISDMATLEGVAELYANSGANNKIRLKSVTAEEDPQAVLEEVDEHHDLISVEVINRDDHYGIELERKIKRSDIEGGERIVEGSFDLVQSDQDENIWTAITGHEPDFFEHGILYLLKQLNPEIYSFFLST